MTNPLQSSFTAIPEYLNQPAAMPVPLEMTQIYKFEALVEELTMVNNINGPMYIREFLKAKELASSYYSKVLLDYETAKNETKRQYALSYLERSEVYLKDKGIKPTDESKKQYVQIDPYYQQAKDTEDMFKALAVLIGNKVDKFQNAYEASKMIFSNTKDQSGSRSSLPSRQDEQ